MRFLNKLNDYLSKQHIKDPVPFKKPSPIKFKVMSWGEFSKNITRWQKENAKDQWINARHSTKKLYRYSWLTDAENIVFKPEPKNEHDKNAIAVYLGNYQIGYVPRVVNEQYHNKLIKVKRIEAEIHGGDSKYKDEYGDLIVDRNEPVVDITVLM